MLSVVFLIVLEQAVFILHSSVGIHAACSFTSMLADCAMIRDYREV